MNAPWLSVCDVATGLVADQAVANLGSHSCRSSQAPAVCTLLRIKARLDSKGEDLSSRQDSEGVGGRRKTADEVIFSLA